VAASEGLEVIEVDLRGGRQGLLRIVIDKPAGITHQDCEVMSRQVGAILDVEDVIPHSYTLEVSSPGAERALTREADYQRFAGKLAKVVLKDPLTAEAGPSLAGQGSLRGRIVSCREGRLVLEVAVKRGQIRTVEVPFENVARGNLALEW
jgi:ribosome maturation factor RimP